MLQNIRINTFSDLTYCSRLRHVIWPSCILCALACALQASSVFDTADDFCDDRVNLVNLSTRGLVGSVDEILIGGFVITGHSPQQVLIRASGEALGGLGVPGSIADTVLTLFSSTGAEIATNDDWSDAANSADIDAISRRVGAFPFENGSMDSAILMDLDPGGYTAQVSGADGEAGMALVEIYISDGFTSLFDGKTLDGWTRKNGTATYRVEAGAIIGITSEGSPNSFLCSNKEFSDFELLFEVKVDDALNSGVQIRSSTREPESNAKFGRVNGPQVEIESGPGQAGWIYGEATGHGWLSPEPRSGDPSINQHNFFKNNDWNVYRVVANGPKIRTYVNGHMIADLTHRGIFETHPSGFIGLQVHSISRGTGPFEVAWRNIMIREIE